MILTVCPNPCIDCTLELEKFNVGRLNRIENKIERWAGKALNTAVGVARLGGKVQTTGFMFETGGRRCVQYLANEGVSSKFVWSRGRLRVNYKIIDSRSMMTEINDRGEHVSTEKLNQLLKTVAELSENSEITVISGSLPGGAPDEYYEKLVRSVNKNSKVIVDCEKGKLLYAISAGVYLVKPNLSELEAVNEESYTNLKDMVKGCNKLIDRGAGAVLLSLGKDGAILSTGSETYYCKSGNVAVNSTVGAGDSMLAAVSLALSEGKDLKEVLRCGVAAGTASVTTSGTNLFYKDKYEEIYEKISAIEL
ncbi:MAG: 1-phosphofructokinase family hexose kinase [Clostridia bacterium]|nr:1-phosphofructokinase family hexose kinase [Clostridia bacterium]